MEHTPSAGGGASALIGGRSLDEWNAAYTRVEGYLIALRIRNKLLRARIVLRVISVAMGRALAEPHRTATCIASEEMERSLMRWYASIFSNTGEGSGEGSDWELSTRGRLALLLVDMPECWQAQFLQPPPWPAAFVEAMRASDLHGPRFQFSDMQPRPLDLGLVTTMQNLGKLPYLRMVFAWGGLVIVLVLIFKLTH